MYDGRCQVLNVMLGAIECGTHQVGHSCIYDNELLLLGLFDVETSRDERATLPYHSPSKFEVKTLAWTQFQVLGIGLEVGLEVRNRVLIWVIVVYTQAATNIDVVDFRNACRFEFILQFIDAIAKRFEVVHLKNLAANMEMQSNETNAWQTLGNLNDMKHVFLGNAELVLCQTRCDMRVRMGSNIRIDAEADIRNLVHPRGNLCDYLKLWNAFDVEILDASLKSQFDFPVRFAHSCEDNLVGRKAILKASPYLATTHTIGSKASLLYLAEHFGIGTSLHSIVEMPTLVLVCLAFDY